MSLFQKYKEPVFLKKDSDLERQVAIITDALPNYSESIQKVMREDIAILQYGLDGEKRIEYELQNSHMPMYVLHDLYFEHNGLNAQIDFMIFTYKCVFVVECKNLYGTINIDNKGEFTRSIYVSGRYRKEGIYSPITQNQRHLDLIRSMKIRTKFRAFMNALTDDYFSRLFIPIVVIANDKTVLNDRYAKKEIKSKIIKSDQLISFMKETNRRSDVDVLTDKEMREGAESWLSHSVTKTANYLGKYDKFDVTVLNDSITNQSSETESILCPKCGAPMIKRVAKKGDNAGKAFYGCSRFPSCRGIVNVKE